MVGIKEVTEELASKGYAKRRNALMSPKDKFWSQTAKQTPRVCADSECVSCCIRVFLVGAVSAATCNPSAGLDIYQLQRIYPAQVRRHACTPLIWQDFQVTVWHKSHTDAGGQVTRTWQIRGEAEDCFSCQINHQWAGWSRSYFTAPRWNISCCRLACFLYTNLSPECFSADLAFRGDL